MDLPELSLSSLLITPTVFSFFDGKLTPKRSEMLVLGYCANHGYIEITLDLIRIVILFFNPLLYWTIRFDHVCHRFDFRSIIIRRRHRFDFRSWSWGITVDFLPGTITDITDTIQYGFRNCSHASNYGNIFPSQDEFNISLTVNKNVVYAKVNSKYDDIQLIVIRIRIFCVENEQEIEKILVTKNNKKHKICSYSHQYYSFHQDSDDNPLDYLAIDNESMVGKNIGFDADIQHILYADGNYW
eukprot:413126_1